MTGFYSKDFILESTYGEFSFSSLSVYVIAIIGAVFTTLYSTKVLYLTFLTYPNGPISYYRNAQEGDIFLNLPLVILAIFSIFFGYIAKDVFIGLGSDFLVNDNSIRNGACAYLLLCWLKFNSTKCTRIIFNIEKFVLEGVKLDYCTIQLFCPNWGLRSFSLTCESYSSMSMFALQNLTLLGQRRYYSSINKQPTEVLTKNNEQPTILDPWFVTGFADGEGSFSVSIYKNAEFKVGWRVLLNFSIGLNEKDQTLLQEIKNYFSVGSINWKHGMKTIQFRVVSIENLQIIIINHFDKYPLITNKWADYQLFKQIFQIIQRKEHLTFVGLRKIVGIRASMNQGLSLELKRAFSDVVPVSRPSIIDPKIYDPNLLAGFTAAEGSFMVIIQSKKIFRAILFDLNLA